jgi:hypothetical protein
MTSENYSPIMQGDTGNPFSIQFLYDDGTPKPLSGCHTQYENAAY